MTTTKPQSTTETLEPCPSPDCRSIKATASNDFANYYVYCPDCFLRGPRESVDNLGARWNALPRISPASAAPVVDTKWDMSGLKEACQRGLAMGRYRQEFDLQLVLDMLLEIERLEVVAATAAPRRARCVNCAESLVCDGDKWTHEFAYRPECTTAAPRISE